MLPDVTAETPYFDGARFRQWAELVVDARLDAVGPAAEGLVAWLRAHGVSEGPELDGVGLAVSEALSNAIRHGGPATMVRLGWCWDGADLEVEVSEPGQFCPPSDWAELPGDDLAEGGRGGFLITQLMDAVEHRNRDGRHRLLLRKRLQGAATKAADAPAPDELDAIMGAMTEELGNAYETIAALVQMSEALATATDVEDFAGRTVARLAHLTGADVVQARLFSADGGGLARVAGGLGVVGPEVLPLNGAGCEAASARDGQERTLAARAELAADDPLAAPTGCAFVCPFSFEDRRRGVLVVARDRSEFFTAGQLGLVRTLADFLGIACANADLIAQRQARQRELRELEIAATIQRGLLPERIAPHRAWAVHGECVQASEVGGDFFDVIDLPTGGRLVVIADVMGKGVPAALMAATLRTAVRAHAVSALDPAALLTKVNRQLGPDLQRLEMFMTAQVLHLDAAGGMVSYASAGHCPIFVLNAAGAVEWWDTNGLPLGVDDAEVYEGALVRVQGGRRLLLMTDGAVENEDAQGRQLPPGELAAIIRGAWTDGAGRVCARVLEALRARSVGGLSRDDCTLVAIEALVAGKDVT